MRKWYEFKNSAAEDEREILIYGDIGRGWWSDESAVSAQQFIADLDVLPDSVRLLRVRVNSGGGNVFEAVAIANALRDQRDRHGRTVETHVDGLAASAATIITSAGEVIRMADNGLFMVHMPMDIVMGNADELRKGADVLDRVMGSILATYRWVSKKSEDELIEMMRAETWMDADQALAAGFITEKVEALEAAASIDARAMKRLKVPERFASRVAALVRTPPAPAPQPPALQPAAHADVMRLCTAAGLDLQFANALVAANVPAGEIEARVTVEKTARAAEAARRTTIRGACTLARLPMLADGYIAGGMSADAVKAQLVTMRGLVDMVEIDTSLAEPTEHPSSPHSIDASWKRAFARVKGGMVKQHDAGAQA